MPVAEQPHDGRRELDGQALGIDHDVVVAEAVRAHVLRHLGQSSTVRPLLRPLRMGHPFRTLSGSVEGASRDLAIQYAVSDALASSTTLREIARRAIAEICSVLGWDVATGLEVLSCPATCYAAHGASFAPDGSMLATLSQTIAGNATKEITGRGMRLFTAP